MYAIPPPQARRVLIADDTFDTRELYGLYLTLCGFAVQTVTDGEAAVEIALESPPDVIVLDLSMPRVDGITATKRLKEHPKTCHIPVIVVTGFPHQAAQRGALEAGADVFLGKPCLPEELGEQIQRLIDRSRKPGP
jgi:two-component system cell cycle response regulator DivK